MMRAEACAFCGPERLSGLWVSATRVRRFPRQEVGGQPAEDVDELLERARVHFRHRRGRRVEPGDDLLFDPTALFGQQDGLHSPVRRV
jgi:hypothetical protein